MGGFEGMPLGRLLITAGLVLVGAGVLVLLLGRLPIRLGRLPGDIYIQGKNSTFYFPIVTCLLISVVLSVVLWIFRR
jgi:hypothetical protein